MRLCCLIPILIGQLLLAQVPADPFSRPEHRFALSLTTGVGSELFTCHLVRVKDGKVLDASPLTRDQFVWQAQGVIPSLANPQGRDLFADHGVEPCKAVTDSSGRRYGTFCPVLDDLWKLRFWEYPFKPMEGAAQHPGQGWAERAGSPSERQLLLLSNYGFRYVGDICHGEDMFRLLKDMCDPAWVDNYRKGY